MKYTFTVKGAWKGSRNDVGSVRSKGFETAVSVDTSMNGPGVGTNPDELLIAATQSCYMITLAYILTKKSLPYISMDVRSEGVVSEEGGLHFESISHYPTIYLDRNVSESAAEAVIKAAYEAEETCMIGNAVKGRVKISVQPIIQKVE
ncbi:MAG: OsmC family protein [Tuberibacillus sp.]